MFNLLKKDFYISRRNIIMVIIMSSISSIGYVGNNKSGFIYIFTIFVCSYLIIQTQIAYDDKNRSDIILNSIPMKRSTIVLTKYIGCLFFTFIIWAIQFIFIGIIHLVCTSLGISLGGRLVDIWDLVVTINIISIYFSVYYPFYFKFGYIKLKMFNFIFYILIFIIPSWIVKFIKTDIGRRTYEFLIGISNENYILMFILCVSLILFILSMTISEKIYNSKDF